MKNKPTKKPKPNWPPRLSMPKDAFVCKFSQPIEERKNWRHPQEYIPITPPDRHR